MLEGSHLVGALVASGREPDLVVVDEGGLPSPEIVGLVGMLAPERVLTVPTALFAELTHLASPARVLAVAPTPKSHDRGPVRFALLLEDLQDPGNVGTIFRSAAAAGVERVYLSKACAFAWSPKVLRAAQGAHFHLDLVEDADLVAVAKAFAGRVWATVVSGGPAVFDADLRGITAFAIGNEGGGLSPALLDAAHGRVTIPMPGGFESLNAAVAASVCVFEKIRQEPGRRCPPTSRPGEAPELPAPPQSRRA